VKKVLVRKDSYYDSVLLMLISQEAKKLDGISDAVVAMATDTNKQLLADLGYRTADLAAATPNDLVIALEGGTEVVLEKALEAAQRLVQKKGAGTGLQAGEHRPATLDAALKALPEANMAVISLPGAYAAREARRALLRGLHVMLFSDNVAIEDEISLKRLARERGLLMMGPDCGTAIINGKPLCFANVVRRGAIGVVAASGTGLQEVTCCLEKLGAGVSQAIGTGGRDLKDERVGGMTMLTGIEALARDPDTRVIAVISKPPAPDVAARVIAALGEAGKPAVVNFVGMAPSSTVERPDSVQFAASLEETAATAFGLSRGGRPARGASFTLPDPQIEAIVAAETRKMGRRQRWLRGLFTGGTLADEAMIVLSGVPGGVYSNNQTDPGFVLADPRVSNANTIVDLGDDNFTVGRPHPMIDPSIRVERLAQEAEDPEVAVILLDLVLGYGSHADPAGAIARPIAEAKARFAARRGYLSVIASVTGTSGDFQGLDTQKGRLEGVGVIVMPSNFQAARLVLRIMERLERRRPAPRKPAPRKPSAAKGRKR
jgi:FdrA protein